MFVLRSAVILSSLAMSSVALALFCPVGFNQMNMGDSPAAVIAECGKPDNIVTTKKVPEEPEAWIYYVAGAPGMPGTLKTEIAFDAKGSVINISVNGAGVSTTQVCNNNVIQFGDNKQAIKAACGEPAYVNPNARNGAPPPKEIEMIEYTYKTEPPVTLVFQDGKLIERK